MQRMSISGPESELPYRRVALDRCVAVLAVTGVFLALPSPAFADSFLPPGFLWGDWVDSLAVLAFGVITLVFALIALRMLRRISASTAPAAPVPPTDSSSDQGEPS